MNSLLERLQSATEGGWELDALVCQVADPMTWEAARMRASMPCGAPEDTVEREARYMAPEILVFAWVATIWIAFRGVAELVFQPPRRSGPNWWFIGQCTLLVVAGVLSIRSAS